MLRNYKRNAMNSKGVECREMPIEERCVSGTDVIEELEGQ